MKITPEQIEPMTLEQVREGLAEYSEEVTQPVLDRIYDWVAAIDAELVKQRNAVEDEICEGSGEGGRVSAVTDDSKAVKRARERIAVSRIAVGSDIHLLEMVLAELDTARASLQYAQAAQASTNAIAQPVSVPESHALETYRLAGRCLWIAFTWNDHNFDSAKRCARKEAELYGIRNIEDANAWLEKAAPKREGE